MITLAVVGVLGLTAATSAWAIRSDLPPPVGATQSLASSPWPEAPWVRIYVAGVPYTAELATHPRIVAQADALAGVHTYEVWQSARGPHGHLFVDQLHAEAHVGGGLTRLWAEFHGEEAERILAVLETVEDYPCKDRYRLWPGPNSNGFAQWVLDEAGVEHRLPRSSFGAGFGCR